MAAPRGRRGPARDADTRSPDASLFRGGLVGIGAVTVATLALAAAGAVIAGVVALLSQG